MSIPTTDPVETMQTACKAFTSMLDEVTISIKAQAENPDATYAEIRAIRDAVIELRTALDDASETILSFVDNDLLPLQIAAKKKEKAAAEEAAKAKAAAEEAKAKAAEEAKAKAKAAEEAKAKAKEAEEAKAKAAEEAMAKAMASLKGQIDTLSEIIRTKTSESQKVAGALLTLYSVLEYMPHDGTVQALEGQKNNLDEEVTRAKNEMELLNQSHSALAKIVSSQDTSKKDVIWIDSDSDGEKSANAGLHNSPVPDDVSKIHTAHASPAPNGMEVTTVAVALTKNPIQPESGAREEVDDGSQEGAGGKAKVLDKISPLSTWLPAILEVLNDGHAEEDVTAWLAGRCKDNESMISLAKSIITAKTLKVGDGVDVLDARAKATQVKTALVLLYGNYRLENPITQPGKKKADVIAEGKQIVRDATDTANLSDKVQHLVKPKKAGDAKDAKSSDGGKKRKQPTGVTVKTVKNPKKKQKPTLNPSTLIPETGVDEADPSTFIPETCGFAQSDDEMDDASEDPQIIPSDIAEQFNLFSDMDD
jgi:hypothetical protein